MVEALPEAADSAQHHGHVEEDVGDQDGPHGAGRPERAVDQAEAVEQGQKGSANYHGGQDERHGGGRPEQRPAPKPAPGQQVGTGQGHDHGEQGGHRGLPNREPRHPPERGPPWKAEEPV